MRRRLPLARLPMPALAQPSTIRIISPYTAGGAMDIPGRFAGRAIGEALEGEGGGEPHRHRRRYGG